MSFISGVSAVYELKAPAGSTVERPYYGTDKSLTIDGGGTPSTNGLSGDGTTRAASLANGSGGITDNPFALGTGDFYLRCIVMKSGAGGSSGALTKRKGAAALSDAGYQCTVTQGGGKYGIGMTLVDGVAVFGGTATSPTLPTDNTPHLFTAIRQGTSLTVYNDLTVVRTGDLTGMGSLDCDQAFCLGGWGDNAAACSDLSYKNLLLAKGRVPSTDFVARDYNGGAMLELNVLLYLLRGAGNRGSRSIKVAKSFSRQDMIGALAGMGF